jgi:hypothetical protein
VEGSTGTFVVVATVDGKELSASARLDHARSANVTLTCDRSSVSRGGEVTCSITVEPSSAKIDVRRWWFVADDPTVVREPITRPAGDEPDLEWKGRMAVSGTVHAAWAESPGAPERSTTPVHVVVSARTWAKPFEVPASIPAVQGDLPDRPWDDPAVRGLENLGYAAMGGKMLDVFQAVEIISGGPNSGLAYLKSVPFTPTVSIAVNYAALQTTGAFAMRHPDVRPAFESEPMCIRSDLPGFVQPIERHEGVTLDPKSHAGRYYNTLNALMGPKLEPIVFDRTFDQGRVSDAINDVVRAAQIEAAKADDDFKVPMRCRLNFFPMPTK